MLERLSGLAVVADLDELNAELSQRCSHGIQPLRGVNDELVRIFSAVRSAVSETENVDGFGSGCAGGFG